MSGRRSPALICIPHAYICSIAVQGPSLGYHVCLSELASFVWGALAFAWLIHRRPLVLSATGTCPDGQTPSVIDWTGNPPGPSLRFHLVTSSYSSEACSTAISFVTQSRNMTAAHYVSHQLRQLWPMKPFHVGQPNTIPQTSLTSKPLG